jgi:hypothetical protein
VWGGLIRGMGFVFLDWFFVGFLIYVLCAACCMDVCVYEYLFLFVWERENGWVLSSFGCILERDMDGWMNEWKAMA